MNEPVRWFEPPCVFPIHISATWEIRLQDFDQNWQYVCRKGVDRSMTSRDRTIWTHQQINPAGFSISQTKSKYFVYVLCILITQASVIPVKWRVRLVFVKNYLTSSKSCTTFSLLFLQAGYRHLKKKGRAQLKKFVFILSIGSQKGKLIQLLHCLAGRSSHNDRCCALTYSIWPTRQYQ